MRTFAMLAIAACGLWLGRPGTAGIVWLWALVAVLLWDPWAPLTPGFWLSYGAVGLLLYASAGRLRRDRRARRGASARSTSLRESARAQWVVTVGLTPLTLALFGQTSLVAPIANALAIPVVTLVVVPLTLTGIVVPFAIFFELAHARARAADELSRNARCAARRRVAAACAAVLDGRRRMRGRACGCSRRVACPVA